MEISDGDRTAFIRKILLSRTRLLCSHPFFGLLLMYMKFRIDENSPTAATDGEYITFGVDFLKSLSDAELDFVLMHEVMHVASRHCFRGQDLSQELFNIACDIVVNSNILAENDGDLASITLRGFGVSMHIAPDGKEGAVYTAEEVYEMLNRGTIQGGKDKKVNLKGLSEGETNPRKDKKGKENLSGDFDDHTQWENACKKDEQIEEVWAKRVEDAAKAIEIREACTGRGLLPLFARRLLKELKEPQIDWRTLLTDFIQEETVDYSFTPPDRRFDGADFFLPDFNDTDIKTEKILFMIDTSGSMDDDMVTEAYSEVKGAIDMFGGKLKGYLGFFDAAIIEPKPFEDEASFRMIKPAGGGGTDFEIVFEYIKKHMSDDLPASIIILTDGIAPFPQEEAAMGIPVLWVINNEEITPPWGKVARIKSKAPKKSH